MRDLKNRLLDLKNLKFEVRDAMRYNDVGDYFDNTIVAYDFKDDVITNAIFLHEFIEYMLVKSAGIDPELIDAFDTDDDAPDKYPNEYELYGKYHDMANMIERQFIENLGLNWEEYDEMIYTVPVKVAIQEVADDFKKHHTPDSKKLEKAKEIVKDVLETRKTEAHTHEPKSDRE